MEKIYNCLLCGVGGQGTVLASKLIAFAAMEKGMDVRTAETIGMAQRGGCVVSHVRMGENIASPLVPKGSADVIIAFEPGEAVRNLVYLKENGAVVVNVNAVMPVTAALSTEYSPLECIEFLKKNVKNLILVDGEKVCAECGSPKVLNTALLASAVNSGEMGISISELKNAITKMVAPKYADVNIRAVECACR